MDCKKTCYWNYGGQCCPEDEDGYKNANPNKNEKCSTYLRKDFEELFWQTYENIIELIKHRKLAELEAIEKFILSQREEQKQ